MQMKAKVSKNGANMHTLPLKKMGEGKKSAEFFFSWPDFVQPVKEFQS